MTHIPTDEQAAKIIDGWFGGGDANYLRKTGSLENAVAAALSLATARGEARERERITKAVEHFRVSARYWKGDGEAIIKAVLDAIRAKD